MEGFNLPSNTHVLYLSYDGMTEPLGQSQVIPYLGFLSARGYRFSVISCEKPAYFDENKQYIQGILSQHQIEWHPISYTKWPSVISTLWDIYRIRRLALKLHQTKHFKIIHCRGYITALVGHYFKRRKQTKFVFDMRGFFADERVDGGLWPQNQLIFRLIYRYFKQKETQFLNYADHTITLTNRAKQIMDGWKYLVPHRGPMSVIPCCVDTEEFTPERTQPAVLSDLRKEFGWAENTLVLSYLGSIGTWYLLDDMLSFFRQLLKKRPQAQFLFITGENPVSILNAAQKLNISPARISIKKADRKSVPLLLSLSDLSIFFIMPTFSKQASSPTKQGEIMAMGIPLVCNTNIGDTDSIVEQYGSGVLIKELSIAAYDEMLLHLDDILELPKAKIRQGAQAYFDLNIGAQKYELAYQQVLNSSNS